MLRLEAGAEGQRRFWEVTRDGARVKVRSGKMPNPGRMASKEYSTPADAEKAVTKAIAGKRAEGFVEVAPPAPRVFSSRKGVSTASPELDALVDEDPADLDRYLVYADWLQQQGDPRGELAIVQHALAQPQSEDATEELEEAEAKIFDRFGQDLLGPLAPLRPIRNGMARAIGPINRYRALAWRCGFVRALRLDRYLKEPAERAAFLTRALAHPSLRHLEHLVVRGYLLAGWPTLPTVRSLRIDAPGLVLDPDFWSRTVPNLRRLAFPGPVASLGASVLPGLEVLTLERLDIASLDVLRATSFPALRELRLIIDRKNQWLGRRLPELRARMPRLAYLSADYDGYIEHSVPFATELLAAAEGLRVHFPMHLPASMAGPNVTIDPEPAEESPDMIERFHHATDPAPPP